MHAYHQKSFPIALPNPNPISKPRILSEVRNKETLFKSPSPSLFRAQNFVRGQQPRDVIQMFSVQIILFTYFIFLYKTEVIYWTRKLQFKIAYLNHLPSKISFLKATAGGKKSSKTQKVKIFYIITGIVIDNVTSAQNLVFQTK